MFCEKDKKQNREIIMEQEHRSQSASGGTRAGTHYSSQASNYFEGIIIIFLWKIHSTTIVKFSPMLVID